MTQKRFHTIAVERQNANDDSYVLVERQASDGDFVRAGTTVAALEGSKSAFEVEAPLDGYIYFFPEVGANVDVGARLAVIAEEEGFDPRQIAEPAEKEKSPGAAGQAETGALARFTENAKALIAGRTFDPELFADLDIVTADDVAARLGGGEASAKPSAADELTGSEGKALVRLGIIGGGQAALQVFDAASLAPHLVPAAIFDDAKAGTGFRLGGVPVLGGCDADGIAAHYEAGAFDALVITLGNERDLRHTLYADLTARNVPFANVVHPSATIGLNARVGHGNIILAHVSVGPSAVVGDNNLISAHCNIEHHNRLGDSNTFGPGVMTSGTVRIGSRCRFGTGIFIEPGLEIGDGATIASGAVLTQSVPAEATVKTKITSVIRRKSER
jgi:sugar O-acyltransferase (sialic acid O-acetyltransferase NeuD family)